MTTGPRPDFFIVGAPKCGTTSLNAYLSAHPAIFMARKEQHFFGSDLADIWPQPTASLYFGSFAGSASAARRGEASGWYLRSRLAAEEIHAYDSRAQIIAILRNPVEMLPSYHSQCLWRGWETIQDFGEALAAESDRRNGRRIPRMNGDNPWRLLYRDVVRFYEQIERYFSVFGKNQVSVLLFDDLVERPAETYKSVLEFLGVDSNFAPNFGVLNANKYNRSRLVRRAVDVVWEPSPRVRRIARRFVPVQPMRRAMMSHVALPVRRANTRIAPRPPIDAQLRQRLAAEFAPDVHRLGVLLGRDMTHWCAPGASRATDGSA
ncbi:MAG: sulfotransferase [Acidobacteriaceae bacterium]|nr:sulfotransferase [Acidobacteriota bacterium]MBV9498471.1 sulfotransferase [Acidobacteriaceae bacterium]